jgi:type II secretory ATPase GspE/PulE/Tfp pilus assembly ATPase PilB-like protein
VPADTPPTTPLPPDFERLARAEPDAIVPALIEYAAALGASDLYLFANEHDTGLAMRHLGILRPLGKVPSDLGRRCVLFVKAQAGMNISERRRPMEGRWVFPRKDGQSLDLRISSIPTLHGEDATVRILDRAKAVRALDQIGMLPPQYARYSGLLASPSGLILVTGPTESGKTTTLYAALSHLNTGTIKINTIEEPIEYAVEGVRQSQAAASGEVTFDVLLRSVLRQAPDVIMIGEIREEETAVTAVRAAGTGHLVLATMHAPVASGAVHSLLRLGVPPQALASSLLGVVSQRLVRTLCPHCRRAYPFPVKTMFRAVAQWLPADTADVLHGPDGCTRCHQSGYAGRTALLEVLTVSPTIRELIGRPAPVAAIRRQATEEGMLEMRHDALLKVAAGVTTLEEVTRVLAAEYLHAAD